MRSKHGEPDDSWLFILAGAAFLAFAFGIWLATGTYSRRWTNGSGFKLSSTPVLDVLAGLFAYAPLASWVWISGRLPTRRLTLWPARAACLALIFAVPVAIWIRLHGLGCGGNLILIDLVRRFNSTAC
jgi:hypothetical protein